MERVDVLVVGAGICGLAVAHQLLDLAPGRSVLVVDKEPGVARHQSGHNSGVLHSGIYYRPGSLKARTAVAGRASMVRFCERHGIAHEVCGKVVVAADDGERDRLRELHRRADANGVRAEAIGPDRLRELEPHVRGVAALHVLDTGIVDFGQVCDTLAGLLADRGAEVRLGVEVLGLDDTDAGPTATTGSGEIEARHVVVCAGLHATELAARHDGDAADDGDAGDLRIVPFRGEYYELAGPAASLVRNLIYPVPDPAFPFLGPHLTRGIDGGVHAGPNAVLALATEGYRWRDVELRHVGRLATDRRMWKLARRHWRTGAGEVWRSLSKRAFATAVQRLVPDLDPGDLVRGPSGVRAQAVKRDGTLVDDFVLRHTGSRTDLVNAPSPAATAALEIGRLVAEQVHARLS